MYFYIFVYYNFEAKDVENTDLKVKWEESINKPNCVRSSVIKQNIRLSNVDIWLGLFVRLVC